MSGLQQSSGTKFKKEEQKKTKKTDEDIVIAAWDSRDVGFLSEHYFKFRLSPLQEILVRKITFLETDKKAFRLSVVAMTRWGKSQCVAIGIALRILHRKGMHVLFIGPKKEQAGILRDYMSDLVMESPELLQKSDFHGSSERRLDKEVSKNKVTFQDKSEYRVFTAHGTGEGLMGFGVGKGGGIIVKDEATLISDKV